MYAYLSMGEPFVHIDNDVYLKTPMVRVYAEQNSIIYQSIEINNYFQGVYQPQFDRIDAILKEKGNNGLLPYFSPKWNYAELAYSAGVFGGNDL